MQVGGFGSFVLGQLVQRSEAERFMSVEEKQWNVWMRPGRIFSSDEISYSVTPSHELQLLFRLEDPWAKAIGLALIGGPCAVILGAAFYKNAPWQMMLAVAGIVAIAILATAASMQLKFCLRRRVLISESWYLGKRVLRSEIPATRDARFDVLVVKRKGTPSLELMLVDGAFKHMLFNVSGRESFEKLLIELNAVLASPSVHERGTQAEERMR